MKVLELEPRLAPAVVPTMLADLNKTPTGNGPSRVIEMNGVVYFGAGTLETGSEVWRSDGTSSSTSMLPPTTVSTFAINGGDAQRSRVTNLVLNFAVPVDAALLAQAGTIALSRTSPNPVTLTVGNGISIAPFSGTTTSITLTFNGTNGVEAGSLADGRWQMSIPWLQYTSPMFHRLFGDFDGNGTVDASDFSFFPAFGSAANSPFDFNNNADVDSGTDFAEFGNRFGLTL